MDSLLLIGTVTLAHLLAVISPGPDFVVLCRNSLVYSQKTGMWTAMGFGLGIMVHISYALFGLSWVVARSDVLFLIIRYLGVGYLLYLGVATLLTNGNIASLESTKKRRDISFMKAIRMGFLTNVLNPKATLFFISLFTLIIGPDVDFWVMTTISILLVVITVLWFSFVAILLNQKNTQTYFQKYQPIFNKFFGWLLIGISIKIAVG